MTMQITDDKNGLSSQNGPASLSEENSAATSKAPSPDGANLKQQQDVPGDVGVEAGEMSEATTGDKRPPPSSSEAASVRNGEAADTASESEFSTASSSVAVTANSGNNVNVHGREDITATSAASASASATLASNDVKKPVSVTVSGSGNESLIAMTPTSPRSITTASMSASDDMVEHENETLRDRVSDLERRVHDQNDEITCLRATLADALRRINTLEAGKGHVQISQRDVRLRREDGASSRNAGPGGGSGSGSGSGPGGTPGRRPASGSYTGHEFRSPHGHDLVGRRASYASNREKAAAQNAQSRRAAAAAAAAAAAGAGASASGLYQSTGSLHSDGGLSSTASMSPSPSSPSPTHSHAHHAHQRSSTAPLRTVLHTSASNAAAAAAAAAGSSGTPQQQQQQRALSGSMSNLSLSGSKKWNSTSDFSREQSPGPNSAVARRLQMNSSSLHSLRSPFGSQHNLSDRGFKHGTKDATFNADDGTVRLHIRGRPVVLHAPTDQLDTFSLAKVSPAPQQKPRLEWVYGYRGRDARSNLYLLPTGEMVYFVAAVVVLFNAEEHTQRHYTGHTEDIKCLAVHPNKLLIATGQTTGHDRREGKIKMLWPHIRIWNSVSLQTLHIMGIGDFERSVVCISFSKADGGNLLVAVDEGSDHTLSLWDWSRGERGTKITETKCSNDTVVAAEFHPLEAGVIVSVGKGHVNFWQLDSTALTLSRKTGLFDQRDKPKYVTCLAFSYTGDLLTGDSNGNVFIWGRGYNAVTKALRKVHDGPIFSICVLKDGSIVTGGGKDRRLVQFDTVYKRTGMEAELPEHLGSVRTISQGKGSQLLLGSTRNSILQGTFELSFQEIVTGHVDEVWALSTHPQQNQFLSAGYDQHIHLWDTLSHRAIWSSNLGDQAQSSCFSSTGEVIVVGMASGKWMVLDSQTREVYGVFQDGHEPIQTVRFSPNDKFLALGSRDNIIYIYQVADECKKFNRMGRCMGETTTMRRKKSASSMVLNTVGHSSYVTHLDWSTDSTYLQSNSGDFELLFWNATICRPVTNPATMRDVTWASQTCILGFHTIGVWPETVDGTDLNTCARANNNKLLATGDDFGKIKLYTYPTTQPKSLHHTVGGHSSHVTRLDFLPDDNRIISAGGRDTALMQWVLS